MSCESTHVVRVRIRRDTAARWNSFNPTLCAGEIGYDLTINNLKIGDGVTKWTSLPYLASGSGGATWGGIIGNILDQADLIAYIASQVGSGGGNQITDGAKQSALQLNANWGVPPTYDGVMVSNVSIVTTGQGIHDYFVGTDGTTTSQYKYEIVEIGATISVIRQLMRY